VSFLTDGIIKYKGKYYILEIKTMNTQKYIESKQVRSEHTAQGTLYCLLFHLSSVLYLYEDRGMLNKKAFLYNVTEEMKDELVQKMQYISDCVEKQTPPDIPENKKCTYCPYMNLCNLNNN
jgi:CRISPR/Cas system-associated exonuclease Cas4 (RecB family)